MKTSALLSALVALALAVPGTAAAAHRSKAASSKVVFPMKADEFRKLAEARIEKVKATVDKKLDHHGVSSERKKAIHRAFDDVSKDVRAEIAKAAADGTVTQAENDKVKTLTLDLRTRLRERLQAEKSGKPIPPADKAKKGAAEGKKAALEGKKSVAEGKKSVASAPKSPAKAPKSGASAPKSPAKGAKTAEKNAKAAPAKGGKPAAKPAPIAADDE